MSLLRRKPAISEHREAKTKELEEGVDEVAERAKRLRASNTYVTVSAHIRVRQGKLPP